MTEGAIKIDKTKSIRPGGSRKKYIPGLACLKFRPQEYWTPEEARQLYYGRDLPDGNTDRIKFEDCIVGMKAMPSNSVDLVIADPPFGLDFSGKEGVYNRDEKLVIDSYHEVNQGYGTFTERWLEEVQRVMKPTATAYVFSGWNHLEDVLRGARQCNLTTINHLIWKYQFGVFTKKKYVTSHYHILFLAKNDSEYFYNKMEHYPLDIWDIKRKYRIGEPKNATTLPVDVVKKCIEFSSRPGDLVFDPFMGMGTTAVAAKSVWRHFFGFEVNEKMKEVIDNRLARVLPGQDYITLEERIGKIKAEAIKRYPQAFRILSKDSQEAADVKS